MGEWQTVTAAQFCASVRDGTHDSPKPVEHGRFLVTSRHIVGGRLDLGNAYLISQDDFVAINKRSKVDRWDVLISMIGTVGEPCLIKEEPNFAIKNIGLFKSKNELEGKWLYYYLRSPNAQQLIREQSRGTTQQYIPLGALREFPVRMHTDKNEMRAIVEVLGTLDDKIELNRRMNETLEAIARAIFKSWFVDFDPVRAKAGGESPESICHRLSLTPDLLALFPDRLVDSELGEIPEGWEAKPLDKISTVGIGKTPPRKEHQWFSENPSDVPWISIRDLGEAGVFILRTSEFLTAEAVEKFRVKRIPSDTVVLSFKLTMGRVAITDAEMLSNEAIAHFRLNPETTFGSAYLYCYLKGFGYDELGSTSSIATAINSDMVRGIRILVPSREIAEAFERTNPLFTQMKTIQKQSHTLSTLRDALLPKLLSGELRVSEADSNIEVCA
ncbi:MAG: restriction endonuclease subunit S [Thiobacillus sp.]|nr:restriction endonuclease subunit S [Thiobacillus sp.]